MQKILTLGMMLLVAYSCMSPTIKKPVDSCVINTDFMEASCGKRNLNYKSIRRKKVGEWKSKPERRDISFANNYVCFSLESWLKVIKPTLKEGHDFYYDLK